MKITVELDRKKAQEILGETMLKHFFANIQGLRIDEVSWTTYGSRIEVVVTDEPEIVKEAV
jgi:hypothetical protein